MTPAADPPEVFAYACRTAGAPQWGETIHNASSRGQAKALHFSQVSDAWQDVPFTAMRARKIGRPHSSEAFIRNAAYRGMPALRCGDRVACEESIGHVVGHDSSANFLVRFYAGRFAGAEMHCHPVDIKVL